MFIPKLLIIDDDPGIRAQLKWGLEGYDVITANCRPDALEQIGIHNPPLVTLDLGMPPDADGTSEGFTTLKLILEKAPDTKVVIVSGAEESGGEERAKSNGAYGYCAKPVEIIELQKIIQRAYSDFIAS